MRHLSGLVNTLKRLEFHRGSKVTELAFLGKFTFLGKKRAEKVKNGLKSRFT